MFVYRDAQIPKCFKNDLTVTQCKVSVQLFLGLTCYYFYFLQVQQVCAKILRKKYFLSLLLRSQSVNWITLVIFNFNSHACNRGRVMMT